MTFWALGEIVKAQCGIHENDDATVTAAKLDDAIADLIPEEERSGSCRASSRSSGRSEDVELRDRRTGSSPAGALPRVARRSAGRWWS